MARAHEMLTVQSGDVKLAVYVSGSRRAPPLILVHGYPDSAAVWAPIGARLAKRYRVIAYDVRGAGASDAPRRRADYTLARLAGDLKAVADATCGGRPFHLVGHDWGSIQCWEAVTDPAFRGRIASYTSISGPCLDHVFRAKMRLKQSLSRGTSRSSTCRWCRRWCGGSAARHGGRAGCSSPNACAPSAIPCN